MPEPTATTVQVRTTREYQVDIESWVTEYCTRPATAADDIENYLSDRGVGDPDFTDYQQAAGIVHEVRRTVLVGAGPRLLFAPAGAEQYALRRLTLALTESPERRDPALLLQQLLTDLGVRLVVE